MKITAAPKLLTTVEVAKLLRLTANTVGSYARKGIIPCLRLPDGLRFDLGEVNIWLETCRGSASKVKGSAYE